ncbi:hypothetical protein [Paracoccus niistensis]|uniref:hypothetical protein n=1 Tax=Paracoccus niistensis TaxID=632935 RepID=UPI00366B835A
MSFKAAISGVLALLGPRVSRLTTVTDRLKTRPRQNGCSGGQHGVQPGEPEHAA